MKSVDFTGFSAGYLWVRIPPSPVFKKACKTAENVDFTGFLMFLAEIKTMKFPKNVQYFGLLCNTKYNTKIL